VGSDGSQIDKRCAAIIAAGKLLAFMASRALSAQLAGSKLIFHS